MTLDAIFVPAFNAAADDAARTRVMVGPDRPPAMSGRVERLDAGIGDWEPPLD